MTNTSKHSSTFNNCQDNMKVVSVNESLMITSGIREE